MTRRRRGLTPVIATIILSAVVIAVGGAVWSYAQGATTVIANDYVNGTLMLMNEAIERFTVEHVGNSSDGVTLLVWVYNYGDLDIVVRVYANVTEGSFIQTGETTVASKTTEEIQISFPTALQHGDEVAIKVHSRRQNNAYYKYYVP